MSKFIKLTNILLNINDIHKIIIQPAKYEIYIINKKIDSYAFLIYGSGFFDFKSNDTKIDVCKMENPSDYKIISDWIDRQ